MSQISHSAEAAEAGDDPDFKSETIILATADADLESHDPRPQTVRNRLALRNRIRGTETRIVLFEEHYLACRVRRRKSAGPSALFNLRYLNASPAISRKSDHRPLFAAAGALLACALLGLLALSSILPAWTGTAAFLCLITAAVSLYIFARRNTETVVLSTAAGRVPVLHLQANFGCIRELRRIVPQLVAAIRQARSSQTQDRNTYLRREMREHYRLHETGVISGDICSTGTRQILSQFG